MSEILSKCRVYLIVYRLRHRRTLSGLKRLRSSGALTVSSKADGFEGLRSSSGGMNTSASVSAVAGPV